MFKYQEIIHLHTNYNSYYFNCNHLILFISKKHTKQSFLTGCTKISKITYQVMDSDYHINFHQNNHQIYHSHDNKIDFYIKYHQIHIPHY